MGPLLHAFALGGLALALLGGPAPAMAALEVVATAPSMGALVRELAGDRARVKVLAGPDRDLHSLQVKPTYIAALSRADLVVAIGAELEVGWLPPVLASSANPPVLPGQPGYFEAALQVDLLDSGGAADRALGDVHPVGNPHLDLDPVRMAQVAHALAGRLGQLDPGSAAQYRARAAAFARKVDGRVAAWQRQLQGAPGVVLYHRDAQYLLQRFGVPLLGTLEPIPGVAPTARQTADLAGSLRGKRGLILYTPYQSPQAPERLARGLGWRAQVLPLEPPADADGDGYLAHIGRWVDAIAGAQ
jgi:zinc/manganese transport system substrate-binding protein